MKKAEQIFYLFLLYSVYSITFSNEKTEEQLDKW